VDTLADDADRVLAAINTARAAARARVWAVAGEHAPGHGATADDPLIIDVDATLVTAHSDKQGAARTFKRGFGFHPLARSSTTATTAPANRWRCCCVRAMPGRTLLPTTSPWSGRR
jgi:hypothetical protein